MASTGKTTRPEILPLLLPMLVWVCLPRKKPIKTFQQRPIGFYPGREILMGPSIDDQSFCTPVHILGLRSESWTNTWSSSVWAEPPRQLESRLFSGQRRQSAHCKLPPTILRIKIPKVSFSAKDFFLWFQLQLLYIYICVWISANQSLFTIN